MDLPSLTSFLEKHPSIKSYTRSSPEFDELSAAYVIFPHKAPVIVRPQSADDVCALVTHCVATDTPFVVSSGLHDTSGRSQVEGALRIDMRDIAYVEVAEDRQTAKVGGGVLCVDLLEALAKEDLMTPSPVVGSVGYAGWLTQGGYSGTMARFGLGIDQLVGARVVNHKGECVEADEDLLEGLRGGGGNFGIVVELTIKTYPQQEVQSGLIIFQPKDPMTDIKGFFQKWNDLVADGLPERLSLFPLVYHVPDVGPCAAVLFTWLGSLDDEGAAWRDRVAAMGGPALMNGIKTTTLARSVVEIADVIAATNYPGRAETVNVRGLRFSDEVIDVLARYGAAMPPSASVAGIHVCHGYSTRNTANPALFRYRVTHCMLEIVGLSSTPEGAEECRAWAAGFGREMREAEGVLEGSYLPLTPQDVVDLEKIYGAKYGRLLELKRRYDPHNVFRSALPRLEV